MGGWVGQAEEPRLPSPPPLPRVFLSVCPTLQGVCGFVNISGWVGFQPPPPPREGHCGGLWVSAEGAGQGILPVVAGSVWVWVSNSPPPRGGGTFVGLRVCQKSSWVGPSSQPPPPPDKDQDLPPQGEGRGRVRRTHSHSPSPPSPLPPPYSNTLPRHPMPPRAQRVERVEKKLGRGKGTNKGRQQDRSDRARQKRRRAQKEEKERKKGKESLWLLEAPARKIIVGKPSMDSE